MKKKYFIYTLCLLSFVWSSCDDYLEVKPTNVLSVSNYSDIKALLGAHLKDYNDARGYLKNTNLPFYESYGIMDYLILHFYSDDYNVERYLESWVGTNNKGDFHKSLDWKHPDIHEEIWKYNFSNIGFYNMILHELSKFPGGSEKETNIVKAEAKVLRAWTFFRLMQLFSPYHENKYGLPLNTDAEKVGTYDKSRKTQVENYKFIISELEEVLSYKTEPSSTYNIFFDKHIIQAILAQVYHYKGDSGAKSPEDYEKAIDYAQKAMKDRLSFDVVKREPVDADLFGMHKNKDYALLSFVYNDSSYFGNIAGYPNWGYYMYASDELYNLYATNDKRKELFFTKDKGIIKLDARVKYQFYKLDLFTGAEMQLIIAESYARKGNDAKAIEALEQFTQKRYSSAYVRPANETLLQSILNERRKEFCFEYGMRWIDLTRIQKGWSRKALDKKEGGEYTLEDGDFRFCMPIPRLSELQENKIEQNPGWGNF